MNKILLTIFCFSLSFSIHAQVSDEIEAIRHSNLDSVTKTRYEEMILFQQRQKKAEDHKSKTPKTKSLSLPTTVSKTVTITAGGLKSALGSELTTVTNLTVNGTIDARDFKTMRDEMNSLSIVDISAVSIVSYTGTDGTAYGTASTIYKANTIPQYAFENNAILTSIILPTNVTCIGNDSFGNCKELTSVTIPSSVTTIESFAFSNCVKLPSINIPSSVTSIENYSLSGLVSVESANQYFSSTDGILFNKTKTKLFYYPTSKTGGYTIPSTVTSIESFAFDGRVKLTSITIPISVTGIGRYSFDGCIGLTSIFIPSSVTAIEDNAFRNCIAPITVDGGNNYYSSINGVLFNKDKTTLIFFPASPAINNYSIPNTVKTIGYSAFWDCKGLTNITIPSSVISIEGCAFCGCSGLVSVSIPASVKNMSYMTFYGCTGLTSIYAYQSIPIDISSSGNVFDYVNKTTCILYVPKGSKNAYQAADKWKDFTSIIEMSFSNTLNVSSNTVNLDYSNNSSSSVTIKSNTSWVASSDQTWLIVTPASGSGNDSITLSTQNNDGTKRTANVTISAVGAQSQIIKVTQSENNITLETLTMTDGCEGALLTLPYTILTGFPTRYKVIFGSSALLAGFINSGYLNLSSQTSNGIISINIPKNANGTYDASLQMEDAISGKESILYPFSFTVNLSSDYIISKFDDVVLCNNSLGRFNGYQWYKNGVAINGATRQFYIDPLGLNGSYSLKVTTTDKKELFTCSKTLNLVKKYSQKVKVYPNPLKTDEACTLEFAGTNEEEMNGSIITIYNVNGICIYHSDKVVPINLITHSFKPGCYVGHVLTVDGKDYSFKLLVSQ